MFALQPRFRLSPHALALIWALGFLLLGLAVLLSEQSERASLLWALGVGAPLLLLLVEVARNFARGETGVDVVALLAMVGALLLGETLAGVVVAIMFAGGNVLEEHAQGGRGENSPPCSPAPRAAPSASAPGSSRPSRSRRSHRVTGWSSPKERSCRPTAFSSMHPPRSTNRP